MTKLELLNTWFHRVWGEEDTNAIYEMFEPKGTAEGLGDTLTGPDDFAAFQGALLNLCSNVNVTVDKSFEYENWITCLCTMKCTNKNGDALGMTGTVYARIENDKIVEAYNHFDFMSLFEQLELLPDDTFAKCISGVGIK